MSNDAENACDDMIERLEARIAELERELAEARFKLDKLDKLTITLTCTNARMAKREVELKQQLSTARADERELGRAEGRRQVIDEFKRLLDDENGDLDFVKFQFGKIAK